MAEMLAEFRGRQEHAYQLPEDEIREATAKINVQRTEALKALTAEELAKARLGLMVQEYRLYINPGDGLSDMVEPEELQWMDGIRYDALDVSLYLRRRAAEDAGDESPGQLLTDEQIAAVLAEAETKGQLPLTHEQFTEMFRNYERSLFEPAMG
ncbi:MAG: hypothetical protein Q7R60_04145 [bacterium]|nr:hypothetical protein [bacterium]